MEGWYSLDRRNVEGIGNLPRIDVFNEPLGLFFPRTVRYVGKLVEEPPVVIIWNDIDQEGYSGTAS
ncbi:MAG TPA: hypothetical protein VJ846_10125 [Sphingomicrobium sp.]|nr:hypothetical protein [Sphingomicrobium sp.]